MPGGLDAVKRVTAELHAAGVKVLWPYNPWDTGTRREPKDDAATFAELLKQTGARLPCTPLFTPSMHTSLDRRRRLQRRHDGQHPEGVLGRGEGGELPSGL